ncbi:MAG: ADP-ribosylglycohydrolase family protein [Gammaproteobacteria bacterium]|nr:ADP-ribosylglycohydrolase family protein [Gammaproteobacteria bacterium]
MSKNGTQTVSFPNDYEERTYAGVLGKIIGVYLGRPFEGWTNERIEERLGEIDYYVHDKLGVRLVVTDDDISGTFTFVRALEDYGFNPELSPKQIGRTWLNYLIQGRTVLWWGGLGNSTEHTAYLRLNSGIDAPLSGAIETNGQVVAEQIGAQIFIDGWGMVNPGDPARAADFARRAASVSHDGEAVIGAQILAAMEAQAYVEEDIDSLIDAGLATVPSNSLVAGMIQDIRAWHADSDGDWRKTFSQLKNQYGYDKYGGNCHIVPNHGLIILAFLHGNGDFAESLKIVNTAGWDTDCNSGNLGCLMGIRNGLNGIDSGPDWRGPFKDICYLPTADSGGGVSDAATIARRLVRSSSKLHGLEDIPPKEGARFHFAYPGSVQGFEGENCSVENALIPGIDQRGLRIRYESDPKSQIRAMTPVFVDSLETSQYFEGRGYGLMTSPMVNPGQIVSCQVFQEDQDAGLIDIALNFGVFDEEDQVVFHRGPTKALKQNGMVTLECEVPDFDGFPISSIGLEVVDPRSGGTVFLNSLNWSGSPKVSLGRRPGRMWSRAWVNGVDSYWSWAESFRLIHNTGTGLLLYGNRDWTDYRIRADVTPHLVNQVGIACRVQGMRRYYALILTRDNRLQIVRELDGRAILAETFFELVLGKSYDFALTVFGHTLIGAIDGQEFLRAEDSSLSEGGIALLINEGRTATQTVSIEPA